jgi:ubiquinone/menaquinone biosynthesis C-methylase UbiE
MDEKRKEARQLANAFLEKGDPLGWFEELYALSRSQNAVIPWADREVNPNLQEWLNRRQIDGQGKNALIIGCGLGDDAECFSGLSFETTAFDISPTAVAWCKERFPNTRVQYLVVDLFSLPDVWADRFDFVFESYTLQVIPNDLRPRAIRQIARCLKPGGRLLVIARGREEFDPRGEMPWPLARAELDAFTAQGLTETAFEDYRENAEPPVRRFRVEYQKPSYFS